MLTGSRRRRIDPCRSDDRMTLSDFERRDLWGQNIRLISLILFVFRSTYTTKFASIAHEGRIVFLEVSHVPTARGGSPVMFLNFGDSLLYMHTPLTQNYQIWRGSRWEGGAFILGSATPLYLKRAEFHGFPIFGVLLYLCILHFLTQDDHIRHDNTHG